MVLSRELLLLQTNSKLSPPGGVSVRVTERDHGHCIVQAPQSILLLYLLDVWPLSFITAPGDRPHVLTKVLCVSDTNRSGAARRKGPRTRISVETDERPRKGYHKGLPRQHHGKWCIASRTDIMLTNGVETIPVIL